MVKSVSLEVFVPLHECSCHYSFFTQKIFRVTEQYKFVVKIELQDISSPDGVKYGLKDMTLVVNKETKLPASFKEEELSSLIEKNLK